MNIFSGTLLHNIFMPSIFSVLFCDVAELGQIMFQDGATPTQEGIVELHDTIFFYLIVIATLVL
jgi:cytochrome c oxidase subunit 2